jgi:hypothetical protein
LGSTVLIGQITIGGVNGCLSSFEIIVQVQQPSPESCVLLISPHVRCVSVPSELAISACAGKLEGDRSRQLAHTFLMELVDLKGRGGKIGLCDTSAKVMAGAE